MVVRPAAFCGSALPAMARRTSPASSRSYARVGGEVRRAAGSSGGGPLIALSGATQRRARADGRRGMDLGGVAELVGDPVGERVAPDDGAGQLGAAMALSFGHAQRFV